MIQRSIDPTKDPKNDSKQWNSILYGESKNSIQKSIQNVTETTGKTIKNPENSTKETAYAYI